MASKPFFVITQSSTLLIDYNDLHKRGISCILFDIEGTLTPWGEGMVSDELRKSITEAGINKIGIVSNMHKNHLKRAVAVGDQIGAHSVMLPLNWRMRKPAPAMVYASLQKLGAEPKQTVFVGDKLIDVLTAKNAGLAGVIWVDVMNGPDHWFDKNIYRRIEPYIKQGYRTRFKNQRHS